MLDPKRYPMLGGKCGCSICIQSKTITLADLKKETHD